MSQDLSMQRKQQILVVDDHQLILSGSLKILEQKYPNAKIFKAETAQEALNIIAGSQLDLVVIDLSIPEKSEMTAQVDTGIQLLKTLMGYSRDTCKMRHAAKNC
jgi:DNA-binding NarL/FixJ family response regulator